MATENKTPICKPGEQYSLGFHFPLGSCVKALTYHGCRLTFPIHKSRCSIKNLTMYTPAKFTVKWFRGLRIEYIINIKNISHRVICCPVMMALFDVQLIQIYEKIVWSILVVLVQSKFYFGEKNDVLQWQPSLVFGFTHFVKEHQWYISAKFPFIY